MLRTWTRNARFLALLAALAVGGSFGVGFLTGKQVGERSAVAGGAPSVAVVNRGAEAPAGVSTVDFDLYWQVWSLLERDYLRQPVDEGKRFYGSLAGMVESLGDPYSAFFDPKRAELFREDLSGSLEGIGAEIGIRDDVLTVIAPLAGTPAERAGLRSGDRILEIDGASTLDLPLEEAVARIRGERGTAVKLLVHAASAKDGSASREVSIVRDVISIESVQADARMTPSGAPVALVRVSHFNGDTVERFDGAVRELLARGDRGVILDLRNDPGGFLDAAIVLAGEWIEQKVVVRERANDGRTEEHRSSGLARLQALPTVVLVNEGSASASEIVAGALQDYGNARIVGTQTFGKGTVQHLNGLPDGSALKLTIAEWLTPSGRSIEKNGITPDVVVEISEEDVAAKRDPQLDRALVELDALLRASR